MIDILLNLNNGEEVLYIGQKDNYNYVWCLFYNISIIVVSLIIAYLSRNSFNYILWILISFMIISSLYCLYIYIRDYLTCNIFLTNQRLLLLFKDKLTSVEYIDIYYMTPSGSGNGLFPDLLFFKLKSNKKYSIKFIKAVEFMQKFKEIYPGYDDTEIQERGCRIALIAIPLLLVIYIFLRLFLK